MDNFTNGSDNSDKKFNLEVLKQVEFLQSATSNFGIELAGMTTTSLFKGLCGILAFMLLCVGGLLIHKNHVDTNFLKQPSLLCLNSFSDEDGLKNAGKERKNSTIVQPKKQSKKRRTKNKPVLKRTKKIDSKVHNKKAESRLPRSKSSVIKSNKSPTPPLPWSADIPRGSPIASE